MPFLWRHTPTGRASYHHPQGLLTRFGPRDVQSGSDDATRRSSPALNEGRPPHETDREQAAA